MPLWTLLTPLLFIALTCLGQSMQAVDTTRHAFTEQFYNGGATRAARMVPSVTIQYLSTGDYVLVDITSSLTYKFSNQWRVGAGWNRRVAYNSRYHAFSNKPRTFGPRCFASYDMRWGFSPRVEFEIMNAPVPPTIQKISSDDSDRQWVPAVFVGIEKDYRFMKHLRGSCLIMLRTFNPKHKSPYGEVLNIRFGFYFPVKRESSCSDLAMIRY